MKYWDYNIKLYKRKLEIFSYKPTSIVKEADKIS